MAYVLALLLVLVAVVLPLWRPLHQGITGAIERLRRRPPRWLGFHAPAPVPSAPLGELDFVGRESELKKLFDAVRDPSEGMKLVLIDGPPGSGKRALLEEFKRRVPTTMRSVCSGPLVNLTHACDPDLAFTEIVLTLERDGLRRFDRFRRKVDTYRAKRAGVATAAERRLGLAFQAGKTLTSAFVPQLASELIKMGADEAEKTIEERWMVAPDLGAVVEAFASDLREALNGEEVSKGDGGVEPGVQSAVLLFENLDARPGEPDTELIRTQLLPALSAVRVCVLATVQRAEGVAGLAEHATRLEIRFFNEEETRDFARHHIGIPEANQTLITEIWTSTHGSPQRLAILHRYFQRYPDERKQPALADRARSAVATEQANDLLSSAETDFQQQLIRTISPLRDFNSELIEEVFAALGLQAGEAQPPPATQLLSASRGPRWFTRGPRGWSFDDPAYRESILREFRESDPGRCRKVHLAAARYHRRALDRLDGISPAEPAEGNQLDWLLTYQSSFAAVRRFADPEYVCHLSDWLYHVASVERERAFSTAQDQVAEALFAERHAEAQELLAAVNEASLTALQRTRVRLLLELTAALGRTDRAATGASLRELDQLGGATPLLRAFECWYRGICEYQRAQLPTAIDSFELARARLRRLEEQARDARVLRIACRNATWLACARAELTRDAENAVLILDEQIGQLTAAIGQRGALIPELLAEVHRARAVIYQNLGAGADTVLLGYNGALQALDESDLPEDRARLKLDL
ncbi:MAG: ATP-binding protein, partial [Gemmatimonadales bacterium]